MRCRGVALTGSLARTYAPVGGAVLVSLSLLWIALGARPCVATDREPKDLHHAARTLNVESVRRFLRAGADPNAYDERGLTPVMKMLGFQCPPPEKGSRNVVERAEEILDLLEEAGVDFDKPTKNGERAIRKAIRSDNGCVVRRMLDRGVSKEGLDALVAVAAEARRLAVLPVLIEHGIALDHRDGSGRTPLMNVLQKRRRGWVDAARLLLAGGADPLARSEDGTSILMAAAGYGVPEALFAQIVAHYDSRSVNWRGLAGSGFAALHAAAFAGRVEQVRMLLDAGAEIDARSQQGQTPLMRLASYTDPVKSDLKSRVAALELLLEEGADPDATDLIGKAPRHHAAERAEVEVLLPLVEHSAKPRAVDQMGFDALLWVASRGRTDAAAGLCKLGIPMDPLDPQRSALVEAITRNHFDTARVILDCGADPNRRVGTTSPLLAAIEKNQPDLVDALLRKGADAEARGNHQASALHAAVAARSPRLAERMLSRGIDVDARDTNGRTPLHLVAVIPQKGPERLALAKLLLARGADPDPVDQNGETPLYAVALYRRDEPDSLELARLLLTKGADPNAANRYGKTPFSMAAQRNRQPKLAALLAQFGGTSPPASR